jgi:GWxTD domain-containing protein
MLSILLESAARSMALGILVWVLLRVFRVRNPQTVSLLWTAVLLSALSMPLLTEGMKAMMASAPRAAEWIPAPVTPLLLRPLSPEIAEGQPRSFDPYAVGFAIYVVVALTLFVRLLAGLARSQSVLKRAVRLREPWNRGWDVRVSDALSIPVTYRSTILFPAAWSQWERFIRDAVLLHEQSHVVRRDFYIQLLGGLHRALFWFNPLAWWLQNELARLAEAACDDEAIRGLKDRVSYAGVLVQLARKGSGQGFAGVAMARGRTVQYRVERLLRETAVAPKPSLPVRVTLMAAFMPLVALAAGSWLLEAKTAASAPMTPIALLPRQNPPALQTQGPQRQSSQPTTPATNRNYLAAWPGQEVPDIISDDEVRAFQTLTTDEEREQFIEQFWRRRDPTPDTLENEFRNDYYRRIALANERFGTADQPGWRSDRGRILIKFGEPDQLERHPSGEVYIRTEAGSTIRSKTVPFETWRYRLLEGIGQNVTLEFVDVDSSGEFPLAHDPAGKSVLIKTP